MLYRLYFPTTITADYYMHICTYIIICSIQYNTNTNIFIGISLVLWLFILYICDTYEANNPSTMVTTTVTNREFRELVITIRETSIVVSSELSPLSVIWHCSLIQGRLMISEIFPCSNMLK